MTNRNLPRKHKNTRNLNEVVINNLQKNKFRDSVFLWRDLTPVLLFFYTLLCIGSLPGMLYGQTNDGKPAQVWSVTIKGNKTFSGVRIKDQIATEGYSFLEKLKFWDRSRHKLDKITVKKDVIRIHDFYTRHGFPFVEVHYQIESAGKQWKKKVSFIIHEKAPIRIKHIAFHFLNDKRYQQSVKKSKKFTHARKSSAYQVGRRYATVKETQVTGSYTQALKNLGFAYANVNIDARVDTSRLAARLTFNVDLGPKTYIHHISVTGDSTVSDHYVIRESGLKKGQQYSLKALQDAQRQVINHHLFQFVTIDIPSQPKDSTLDLAMRVRERPLYTVKTSVGFGTEDYVRGQVSWVARNAFNRAHKFTATARASFIEQSLGLNYLFPYVFNTKSSFVISPLGEHLLEPNYELLSAGVTNSLIYQYSRYLAGSLSYEYTKNDEISQRSNANLPDTSKNYDISSLQLNGYYNNTFGRNIHRGWAVQPSIEVSGFFGLADYKFQKLSLDVRRYTPLTKSTTLVTRVQGGKLLSVRTDSLPKHIRYYLGGTSSVRGWYRHELGPKRAITSSNGNKTTFEKYVPKGGRTFFSFNLEIRQDISPLINGFGIAAFLDGGQLWRRGIEFGERPLQFGAGGGLRYNSPIGPVRLYVGYKVNPTAKDLNRYQGHDYGNIWNRIAIHVSIGQAF